MRASRHDAREQADGRAVRRYLDALRARRRAPATLPSRERIEARLDEIEETLDGADVLRQLKLVEERRTLRRWLADDPDEHRRAVEEAFVAHAAGYGRRHGITYAAWRAVGVPPAVLRRAGIRPAPPPAPRT